MDTDADLDAAAEDPPVRWLLGAVAGLVLAGTGLVAAVVDLLGASDSIVAVVPPLAPLFSWSPLVAVLGAVTFVLAMRQWDPDLEG